MAGADAGGMTPAQFNEVRQARRLRVRMIRSRVLGCSVALFIAVWALIAVLMVTGHDPVLARASAKTSSAPSAAGSASPEGSGGSSGYAYAYPGGGASSSAGGGGGFTPAPVTSGQS